MIRPPRQVLKCPQCDYVRVYHPKSDALSPKDILDRICPKCNISLKVSESVKDNLIATLKDIL